MSRRRLGAITVAVTLLVLLPAAALAEQPADVCLETDPTALSEAERAALVGPVTESLEARTSMFPAPTVVVQGPRLDLWAGHGDAPAGTGAACLEPGSEWTARYDRVFLKASADQMLAEAPTTPGIESSVEIEWFLDEARLRTTLEFAGPLDIPNGICWVDDALAVDNGSVVVSSETGVKTSLFAEGACRRFFEHLTDGGAGEQAVTLLPTEIAVGEDLLLRFVVEAVDVREDAVVVSGRFERD